MSESSRRRSNSGNKGRLSSGGASNGSEGRRSDGVTTSHRQKGKVCQGLPLYPSKRKCALKSC